MKQVMFRSEQLDFTYDEATQIYTIAFLKNTHDAVNEWMKQLEKLVISTPPSHTVKMVFDTTQTGNLPLSYFIQHALLFVNKYPRRCVIHYAVLHGINPLVKLAETMAQSVPSRDVIRFFLDEQDARSWLQQN